MSKVIWYGLLVWMLGLSLLAASCKVEDEIPAPRVPNSVPYTQIWGDWIWDVTQTTADCIGWVSKDSTNALIETTGICWSKDPIPTIADSRTINESGEVLFYATLTDLTPNTKYYARAYAICDSLIGYGTPIPFITQNGSGETVTDIDGNVYDAVKIGPFLWMASNLKVNNYNNGDTIFAEGDWFSLQSGSFCLYSYFLSDPSAFVFCNYISNDHLYNCFAVNDNRGICPAGWHVPTDYEWKLLEGEVDSRYPAIDPEWDKEGWRGADANINLMATWGWGGDLPGKDLYGFSALPAGEFSQTGFDGHGSSGYFWTSSLDFAEDYCYYREINASEINVIYRAREPVTGSRGMSVRCVKLVDSTYKVPCPGMPTVSYEGQSYSTVQIGDQCWIGENLNVGTMVPNNQEMADDGIVEKYCYQNDPNNCAIYGGLYQWREAMQFDSTAGSKGICPPGWHIPSDDEWTILINSVGGMEVAGAQMKESGFLHWNSPNTNANNVSGFTGLPGGFRAIPAGNFYLLGREAFFWSSTQYNTYLSNFWCLFNDSDDVGTGYEEKEYGKSIRCLKD